MPRKSFIVRILALPLIFAGGAGLMFSQQNQYKGFVLNSQVEEGTALRFFYIPPGDYFHAPLVFRAVEPGDPRLTTGPMSAEGRSAYISFDEMQQLMQNLAHSNLVWQESDKIEIMGSFKELLHVSGGMDILVVSPKGTADAKIRPTRICDTLKPLDSALKTQRALWEFQAFRLGYACQVPGFKYDAYPDYY